MGEIAGTAEDDDGAWIAVGNGGGGERFGICDRRDGDRAHCNPARERAAKGTFRMDVRCILHRLVGIRSVVKLIVRTTFSFAIPDPFARRLRMIRAKVHEN
ncbi:MAG: hypothetical protein NVSMB1_01120 [Polyangiales bacterium]